MGLDGKYRIVVVDASPPYSFVTDQDLHGSHPGFALNVGDPTQPFVLTLFNNMFGYVLATYPTSFKLFMSMDLWANGFTIDGHTDIGKYAPLVGWKGHESWYKGPNGAPFISTFGSGRLTNQEWLDWKSSFANEMYLVPNMDDTSGYSTSDAAWWEYW